jgi:betaine-aldehyde dehydrogenase
MQHTAEPTVRESQAPSRPTAAEVLQAVPRIGDIVPMYIDGRFCLAAGGDVRELIDPSTGETVAIVAEADADDVETAIAAARRAFDDGPWPRMKATERAAVLFRVADAIDAARDELARIDTLNGGKPLRETAIDIADAADCFRYYAGLTNKPHGQTFDVPGPTATFTIRQPVGVCGQIVPWNYPLLMAVWKLAPALAAGNVCILKPAETTPLSTIRLATILENAGIPAGVVNVVPGAGPVAGAAIAASPLVDKVAFTGGTQTARRILAATGPNLTKVSLELGGKSPNVVFADADFETAIDYALFGIFANAGQICSAGSRLVLQRRGHERFLERLVERAKRIRVGDGFDPRTEMGPLVSQTQRERVERYIEIGNTEGARLLCGGERLGGALAPGNYISPAIFDRTTPEMRVVREEIFGPVLVVQTFETEDEALRIANDTEYGLAAAVFTQDVAKAHRMVRGFRAGITWINTYHPTYNEAPWGGMKRSGFGSELGTYGYEAYTELKQINVNLDVKPSGWFSDSAER